MWNLTSLPPVRQPSCFPVFVHMTPFLSAVGFFPFETVVTARVAFLP